MESLKTNKDIKDLPRYVGEHFLPVLELKQDQTIKKVLELLEVKYGRSRTEKIEECVDDILKFREDQYEDEVDLILVMKEIRQRERELKITQDEWFTAGMLSRVSKMNRIDNHKLQSLRDVVKKGGDTVFQDF